MAEGDTSVVRPGGFDLETHISPSVNGSSSMEPKEVDSRLNYSNGDYNSGEEKPSSSSTSPKIDVGFTNGSSINDEDLQSQSTEPTNEQNETDSLNSFEPHYCDPTSESITSSLQESEATTVQEDNTSDNLGSLSLSNDVKEEDEDSHIADVSEKASEMKEHDVPQEELEQAKKIKSDMERELAENNGWVRILGNDQLLKKITKDGIPNKKPLRGEVVTVRLDGRLKSDESIIFDSQESFVFQLGDAEVIQGLDLAIPLMCKHEISIIKIAPRFGYGSKGLPPSVPPNSDLVYTVELLDFEVEKDLEELTVGQRREIGNRKRERGNWWYGRDETALSIQCYRRALEFLDEAVGGISFPETDPVKKGISDELRLLFDDRLKTYNNMAAAQLKLQAYVPALVSVDSVLKCQPKNVKALFRKGKILAEKGDTEDAISVFKQAAALEPENKAVIKEINKLSAKRNLERQSEKLLYKRMFKNNSTSTSFQKNNSSSKWPFGVAMILGAAIVAVAGAMAYRYAS